MEPTSAGTAPPRARLWIALGSVYLIWGSTYLAIRFAIETLPPFSMAGVRYLVAGGVLVIWQRARGAPWPSAVEWREAAIVGGLMLLGGNGGVCWAEQIVPSGITALFISTVPIWLVLLDWLWLGNIRPSPRIVLGLALGIGGVALLVRTSGAPGGAAPPLGAAVLVLASGLWAVGSLYSRRARLPAAPFLSIGLEMVAGGALLVLAGAAVGEWSRMNLAGASARSLLSLLYLITFGSLIGFSAYIWLLRSTTTARASTYAFVNPVVAMFLGWAFAGETLEPRTLVAAAVAITGVVLILRARAAP
jgi:drug/metabolite transporter (DMT)-like permease